MILTCFICKLPICGSVKGLLQHFKTIHGLNERNDHYSCCEGQCARTFGYKYVFTNHLFSHHGDSFDSVQENIDARVFAHNTMVVDMNDEAQHGTSCNNLRSETESIEDDADMTLLNLKQYANNFILKAKARMTTLENVQYMITACTELVETIVNDLHNTFRALKKDKAREAAWCNFEEKLTKYSKPFAGLETKHQQTEYIRSLGLYVKPESYVLGHRQSFQTDKTTGCCKRIRTDVTAQFISIKSTLLALNQHTDLIRIATKPTNSNRGILRTFRDGNYWANHSLKGQPVIVLRLYGDDVETANPLGSHRTLYKIGFIYFQLEDLPATYQSKLENIFLATCYRSDDVKEYGWRAVLEPLLHELKELECDGVTLRVDGVDTNYKVILSCVTGDNLFLNSILGFVESFTAAHPCRHCNINKSEFQKTFTEEPTSIRTVQSFAADVALQNVNRTGIKNDSALNYLTYFHSVTNGVQDVMHDLLEGICSYDLRLICSSLIAEGLFTLDQLNSRIQSINYSYQDVSSKLPIISTFDCEMLPYQASEVWCLTGYLPFAIGQ